ncbi:MAG: hypothetical protein JST54_29550 [Deltaproteobacteria bacterium]|nr:hypothetical protein [Deltaproteobacteria bacterium]
MHTLLRTVAGLVVMLGAAPAFAQVVDPELFGDGKPPVYREEDGDRRFLKTQIYAALAQPPKDESCRRILATLLVAYSDALPYLHRKDQNFYVDPELLQSLNRSIVTPDFPATAFLASMVRRTLIDKKVPPEWLQSAELYRTQLAAPISTARMKLDSESVGLIDSFSFTVPALLDRYAREVKLAPSVAVDAAEDKFRDKYMDRDIAWGGLLLWDVAKQAPPEPPKKSKKSKKKPAAEEPPPVDLPTWAIVGFPLGQPKPPVPGVPGSGQVPQLQIRARLVDNQSVDLTKLVRGTRVLVKGHLWDIGPNMEYVEVRDASIFPDADWRSWPSLATPRDVANCDIAVNDLSPYGYTPKAKRAEAPNAFSHTKQ